MPWSSKTFKINTGFSENLFDLKYFHPFTSISLNRFEFVFTGFNVKLLIGKHVCLPGTQHKKLRFRLGHFGTDLFEVVFSPWWFQVFNPFETYDRNPETFDIKGHQQKIFQNSPKNHLSKSMTFTFLTSFSVFKMC